MQVQEQWAPFETVRVAEGTRLSSQAWLSVEFDPAEKLTSMVYASSCGCIMVSASAVVSLLRYSRQ